MKTILVPTDFSKLANNALKVAVQIAERTGATLRLLHIIEGIYEGGYVTSGTVIKDDDMNNLYILKLIEKSKTRLEALVNRPEHKGIKIVPSIKVGSVFKHISEAIAEEKIDMIVMGTHGKDEKDSLTGSNTAKVVRHADAPVLAIKEAPEYFKIQKLLLATDYQNLNNVFIDKIKSLQEVFGFSINVLYVNTQLNFRSTADVEDLAYAFKEKHQLENAEFSMVNAYSEEEGIMWYANKTKADVVSMTTHGRKGISLFLFGSVSEAMIKEARQPVLTFKI